MDGQIAGRDNDRIEALHRPGDAAGRHVRVLDADQRDRGMMVRRCRTGPRDIGRLEHAVRIIDGMELDRSVACGGAVLVGHQVLAPSGDDRSARGRQDPHGDLIGHRPRRDEEGRRLSDALGERLLQRPHGRVLPVVVVSYDGGRHGAAHVRCRLGDGVTPQVDQGHHS